MTFTRAILTVLIFFGLLFYFKEPLQQLPVKVSQLHSPYVSDVKDFLNTIKNATSSLIIDVNANYIPGLATNTGTNSLPLNGNGSASGTKTTTAQSRDNLINSGVVANQVNYSNSGELLPVVSNQQEASLTVEGIVKYTNKERAKVGVKNLSLNSDLQRSAEEKLQDMFKNQYFQHISPSGESVSDVVRRTGYTYIVVGENLALGVFAGDEKVVAAWMASPGHKKNILDTRYQDIGVAVGQGMYQGKKQWLIVQHFGKPLSSCPSPDEVLKKSIEEQKNTINSLESEITAMRVTVDQSTGDDYTANANKYNALVVNYNDKLVKLKADIEKYNEAVKGFNDCAGI